jgi:hypothetical protein
VVEQLRQAGYTRHITIGGHFPTYEHYKFFYKGWIHFDKENEKILK